ncbi:hypothetical protein [Archangium sp.]|uniref:hypothetical protein n=1 Tax=Archangium sp. TaxID=1872627 RepID=UPI002D63ABD3|nr:hypothetical protein [Archangium sp.]HYO52431.1 hypothetical protein [Archangium sp.]
MTSLLELFDSIPPEPGPERSEAEYRFIEQLTFSSAQEILGFLDGALERDLLLVPVWMRNLAYRLACLQEPGNTALLRRAASDLRFVGPDWNDPAHELVRRAEALEAGKGGQP